MANLFGSIVNYSKLIDEVFAASSKTDILMNRDTRYLNRNVENAGYVSILDFALDGLSDYYRANEGQLDNDYAHYQNGSGDGFPVGSSVGKWEYYRLKNVRAVQYQIDATSNSDNDFMLVQGTISEAFRTKVVPEVDATRLSTIAENCKISFGNLKSEDITDKPYTALEAGNVFLSNAEVPSEERVCFVSPDFHGKLKTSTEVQKFINTREITRGEISYKVEAINDLPIIEVPQSRFFTDVQLGKKGYYPSATSKNINFIICSLKAVFPVVKAEYIKVFDPTQVQDFYGYKVNILAYHDTFIPKNKILGAYTSVSTTSATTNTRKVLVDTKEGNAAGESILVEALTIPGGIAGSLVWSDTALTLGSAKGSAKDIAIGQTFKPTGTTAHFGIVSGGKLVAVSGAVTIVKHA